MSTTHSTPTTTTTTFDAGALRRAYAGHDLEALLRLYAADAEVELVDVRNTPSHPLRLKGREAIRSHLEDVFGREMTHEVELVVTDGEAAAYRVRCRYPDGLRVLCAATATVRDGRIVAEVGVQAWDDVTG
jgi:ketosteroid isomerase-like protein